MTREQYDLALNEISTEYEKKRREIIKQYAFENSHYKVGDKITDHVATIEIQKIRASVQYGGIPECVYDGVQFNKDGKLSKKQDHTTIYQSNIIND